MMRLSPRGPNSRSRVALIIPKDVLGGVLQRFGPLPLEQIASKNGFNYSKGKQLEVLALIRKTENQ